MFIHFPHRPNSPFPGEWPDVLARGSCTTSPQRDDATIQDHPGPVVCTQGTWRRLVCLHRCKAPSVWVHFKTLRSGKGEARAAIQLAVRKDQEQPEWLDFAVWPSLRWVNKFPAAVRGGTDGPCRKGCESETETTLHRSNERIYCSLDTSTTRHFRIAEDTTTAVFGLSICGALLCLSRNTNDMSQSICPPQVGLLPTVWCPLGAFDGWGLISGSINIWRYF